MGREKASERVGGEQERKGQIIRKGLVFWQPLKMTAE